MSQTEIRAQRQREQDERRLSLQRNNAYFSFKAMEPEQQQKPETTVDGDIVRSRTPDSIKDCDGLVSVKALSCSATTNKTTPRTTTSAEQVPKTNLLPTAAASKNTATIQTGIDRYIKIKRKLSPQKSNIGNQSKINCNNSRQKTDMPNNQNRFAILADKSDDLPNSVEPRTYNPKPPPIFIREKSSNALVNKILDVIGKDSFHIIPLTKGKIHETKVQVKTEQNYRALTQYLNQEKKNYYTYQLKSSKGLQVVIKGIESEIDPAEVLEALREQGFNVKSAINIFNKDKKPQPLFKIELEPDTWAFKKSEVHPIYNLQFLLHRRISVEEPHKRKGPVQCENCQEYGHTKSYCTLTTVCVSCGEPHSSNKCPQNKQDINAKKCSNCGGNHTANYRGCPVYKDLKIRLSQRVTSARSRSIQNTIMPSKFSPDVIFSTDRPPTGSISKNVSFASALKSGLTTTASTTSSAPAEEHYPKAYQPIGQSQNNIESLLLTLQQSMSEFMTFMRTTMEDLMRNQSLLIQMLVSQQSK